MGKLFPTKIETYIRANVDGRGNLELTEMVNEKFKTEYSVLQVKNFKRRKKLVSGVTGYFEKGHAPANKGVKGVYYPGMEKGWFKKGQKARNHRPVGSERIDNKDGYTLVKVAEPRKWRLKQHIVWEESHGPIPKGHKIIFLDADKTNFDLKNLMLVTHAEELIMNRRKLRTNSAEITSTGVLIAKVINASNRRKRA